MAKPAEQELRDAIRERGLRVTQPRLAVLALLRAEAVPLSHADVADRLISEAIDRATLFRNLNSLVEHGLARRTDLGDHVWRFEAVTEDHSHPHFVCTECGAVECMTDAELALPRGRRAPRAVRARQVEIAVRGICDACA
jgi:Fur family ferric uptake transcriptional regulator